MITTAKEGVKPTEQLKPIIFNILKPYFYTFQTLVKPRKLSQLRSTEIDATTPTHKPIQLKTNISR